MGCRCSEIAICQRDLSILSGSISPALSGASSSNAPITPAHNSGSQELGISIYINQLATLQQQLSQANQKQDAAIPRLIGKLGSETSRVSRMLSAFRAEDRAYHEEERNKD